MRRPAGAQPAALPPGAPGGRAGGCGDPAAAAPTAAAAAADGRVPAGACGWCDAPVRLLAAVHPEAERASGRKGMVM